mgnify:CR=1 FL=1
MWSKPAWWTSPQTHKVAAFSTRVLGNACLRQLKTKAFSDCTKVLFPVGSEWHLGLWPFGSPMNKYANFLVRLPGELEIGCDLLSCLTGSIVILVNLYQCNVVVKKIFIKSPMQPEKWKLVSKSGLLKIVFVYFFCTLFENDQNKSHFCITLFKILIFCPKIQLWF